MARPSSRPWAAMGVMSSGADVPLLHFLEDRRHCGEVVVHVEHRVTVVNRCRAHQEVDDSRGPVLPALRELVLSGLDPAPGVLRDRRELTQSIQLPRQLVAMRRAGGRVAKLGAGTRNRWGREPAQDRPAGAPTRQQSSPPRAGRAGPVLPLAMARDTGCLVPCLPGRRTADRRPLVPETPRPMPASCRTLRGGRTAATTVADHPDQALTDGAAWHGGVCAASLQFRASKGAPTRRRNTPGGTREQRMPSRGAEFGTQSHRRDVPTGQGTLLVGRVGLEPTADGL